MWSTLVDLTLPRTCPGCGRPEAWCASCASLLAGRPRRVIPPEVEPGPRDGTEVGLELPPTYALARYQGPIRAAIIAAKEHGRRDLPQPLGQALGRGLLRLLLISVVIAPLWLIPAPTRPSAARRRGGDPLTLMARAAAVHLVRSGYRAGVAPCVYTGRGARDSVGLTAAQRVDNLAGRMRWRSGSSPPPGAAVVLLDDVLTTGATAASAARLLRLHRHPVQAVLTLAAVPRRAE